MVKACSKLSDERCETAKIKPSLLKFQLNDSISLKYTKFPRTPIIAVINIIFVLIDGGTIIRIVASSTN